MTEKTFPSIVIGDVVTAPRVYRDPFVVTRVVPYPQRTYNSLGNTMIEGRNESAGDPCVWLSEIGRVS